MIWISRDQSFFLSFFISLGELCETSLRWVSFMKLFGKGPQGRATGKHQEVPIGGGITLTPLQKVSGSIMPHSLVELASKKVP
jgi:hypothetical protein